MAPGGGCGTSGRAPAPPPAPLPRRAAPARRLPRHPAAALGVAGDLEGALDDLPPPHTTPTRRLTPQEVRPSPCSRRRRRRPRPRAGAPPPARNPPCFRSYVALVHPTVPLGAAHLQARPPSPRRTHPPTPPHARRPPQVLDALYASQHPAQRERYAAFYSSELGGVVTDPALMVVHADDHMVHRGHAVFDTAALVDGHLYQLEEHLARLLAAAARACVPLPPGGGADQLRRIVLETAGASRLMDGAWRGAAACVRFCASFMRPASFSAAQGVRGLLRVPLHAPKG